ncbi:hypothetical protein [Marmoricola sp. RAF53]|uniref:hypothetical protein n=1 Tax=Marmoricola sp. RAF53 TaxID=3233059 RepID=UPI003F9628C0
MTVKTLARSPLDGAANWVGDWIIYLPYAAVAVVIIGLLLAALGLTPRKRTLWLCLAVAASIGWSLYGLSRDITISTPGDAHTYCASTAEYPGAHNAEFDFHDPCDRAELRHNVVALLPLGISLSVLSYTLSASGLSRSRHHTKVRALS